MRISIVEAPILLVQNEHVAVADLGLLEFHTGASTLVKLAILVAALPAEIAPVVVLSESQGITAEDERAAIQVAAAAQHLLEIALLLQ